MNKIMMLNALTAVPMMGKWDYNTVPYKGMMSGWLGGKLVPWIWLVVVYHTVVALVFLLILVLIAVLLWKKIQLMEHVEKRKK